MIVITEFELQRISPPALPLAPEEYQRQYQDQLNSVLRLYFVRLQSIVGQRPRLHPLWRVAGPTLYRCTPTEPTGRSGSPLREIPVNSLRCNPANPHHETRR